MCAHVLFPARPAPPRSPQQLIGADIQGVGERAQAVGKRRPRAALPLADDGHRDAADPGQLELSQAPGPADVSQAVAHRSLKSGWRSPSGHVGVSVDNVSPRETRAHLGQL